MYQFNSLIFVVTPIQLLVESFELKVDDLYLPQHRLGPQPSKETACDYREPKELGFDELETFEVKHFHRVFFALFKLFPVAAAGGSHFGRFGSESPAQR